MRTELLLFIPGKKEPTKHEVNLEMQPDYGALKGAILPLLRCQDLEHVSVLYDGRRADMFVDETSAQRVGQRAPLPVNDAATDIYHEASRARGATDRQLAYAAKIHGPAVLALRRIWF